MPVDATLLTRYPNGLATNSAKPLHMLWVIPAALVEKENAICGNAHGQR
jgi:hypothetical protein